jgi:hypothetical protein
MGRTASARLLSSEFSTVAEKRRTASYVIAFDSSRSVCLRVSGSFREDEAEPFFFGSQSLTSKMRLLTRGRQRKGKSAHSSTSALMPKRDEREDEKAKEKQSTLMRFIWNGVKNDSTGKLLRSIQNSLCD